ncbi:MAG: hypothetical protein UGF89_12745 [Acutalibacteraceae bacterium]|nr:hypothetical protein [Acutalibacteraceae bacterium]
MSPKEAFDNIPRCLKDIFIKRFAIGIVMFVISLVAAIVVGFSLSLPCFCVSGFFLITGIGMLYNCITGEYVIVNGVCKNIELTSVKGKIKALYISAEDGKSVLKLLPKENAKKFNIGDSVIVYVPSKATITKNDGVFDVREYYCIELSPLTEQS